MIGGTKEAKDLVSTINSYNLINTDDTLENYSHVIFNSNIEDFDGEFIVFNCPSNPITKKFYLGLILMAETRNMNKKNRKYDGHIAITDIALILSNANKSPLRMSHGRVFLQLTGSRVTDILPENIECCYKFPIDNVYIVICKSRPNLIEIMPGDMKINKEDEDEDVSNQTTD